MTLLSFKPEEHGRKEVLVLTGRSRQDDEGWLGGIDLSHCEKIGEVYLVGAGPGDPGLMTVKGMDLVRRADVVVHDPMIGAELLSEVSPDAEVIDAGEVDIIRLLVDKALEGNMVVHLKGGDPFLFGRGGEEAEELIRCGVVVHVVPGVPSSISIPALAGIPLTHRDHASIVTMFSDHEGHHKGEGTIDRSLLAKLGGTIVIMMDSSDLGKNMQRFAEGGMDPTTPVTVIEKGSTPEQRMVSADVASIAQRCRSLGVSAPAVVVIGSAASLWKVLGDLS